MPTQTNTEVRTQLGARFSGPLLRFFLRRIRDRAQAEDLAQEVLLKVLRSTDGELIVNPEAYVFKAAGNLLRDHRRRRLRNPILQALSLEELVGESGARLVEDRSPERVLMGEATLEEVLSALGEIGELTRNIFVLFRLENMQQKEIAALHGIGLSTVEKHVMRAMLHLTTRCSRE